MNRCHSLVKSGIVCKFVRHHEAAESGVAVAMPLNPQREQDIEHRLTHRYKAVSNFFKIHSSTSNSRHFVSRCDIVYITLDRMIPVKDKIIESGEDDMG
jgi:thiamine phosphate synthase YjbQ (UPF0047 family)